MQLVEEQCPSAVVLACSDSRCPPELVFDQGLGDLFVVRLAASIRLPQIVPSECLLLPPTVDVCDGACGHCGLLRGAQDESDRKHCLLVQGL